MGSGSQEFVRVYEEHVWHVYGFFGYRGRSREECEDLTQQTFERALKAWKRFDPERASAKTWLLAIAHNLLVDHYRRGSTQREMLTGEVVEDSRQTAPPADSGLDLEPELERSLSYLSDRERELLALRYGGDLSGPEIAKLTGLTLANVQQILSRALRKLRERLSPEPVRRGR